MQKNTIGYTFEELDNNLWEEDINENILKKIRSSKCVKSARKVGKKLFNSSTGKFFKKVRITINENALTQKQLENFYGEPIFCYIEVPA